MKPLNLEIVENAPKQSQPDGDAIVDSPNSRSGPGKLPTIQILRGIAAALVVFHHLSGVVPTHIGHPSWFANNRLPLIGAAGVDIFFVISGFIMFYTTTQKSGRMDAGVFLLKRTLRIYPLYWFWTSVLLLVALSKLVPMNHTHDIDFFVSSYLLIPAFNGLTFHPFLDQGWTLSFEMLFYCIFSLSIWLSTRRSILIFLASSFVGLSLLSLIFPQGSGIKYLLSNTLIVEFLFGVALAKLFLLAPHGTRRKPISTWVPVALVALGVTLLLSTTLIHPTDDTWLTLSRWRFIFWGIPSALIVFGFASVNQKLTNPGLVLLGDASYSTYLAHVFLLRALRLSFEHSSTLRTLPADVELVIATVLTIFVTVLTYLWVERPLTAVLQAALGQRSGRARLALHTS
jgi:exopolysaccharide production protein ExoZ